MDVEVVEALRSLDDRESSVDATAVAAAVASSTPQGSDVMSGFGRGGLTPNSGASSPASVRGSTSGGSKSRRKSDRVSHIYFLTLRQSVTASSPMV